MISNCSNLGQSRFWIQFYSAVYWKNFQVDWWSVVRRRRQRPSNTNDRFTFRETRQGINSTMGSLVDETGSRKRPQGELLYLFAFCIENQFNEKLLASYVSRYWEKERKTRRRHCFVRTDSRCEFSSCNSISGIPGSTTTKYRVFFYFLLNFQPPY